MLNHRAVSKFKEFNNDQKTNIAIVPPELSWYEVQKSCRILCFIVYTEKHEASYQGQTIILDKTTIDEEIPKQYNLWIVLERCS